MGRPAGRAGDLSGWGGGPRVTTEEIDAAAGALARACCAAALACWAAVAALWAVAASWALLLAAAAAACWAAVAWLLAAWTALWSAALWAAAAWDAALTAVASWVEGARVNSQAPTRMTTTATRPPTISSVRLVFSVSRTIDIAKPSALLPACNVGSGQGLPPAPQSLCQGAASRTQWEV